jgi:hypothetical protein
VAVAELRALGTRVYELALDDAAQLAPAPLVDWSQRLAGELGLVPAVRPRSVRDLVAAICELSRQAREPAENG